MELLTPDLVARLRSALLDADFSYDGVAEVLGPVAHAALSRNETTPGLRATAGGSPLETLTRLWPLQAAVDLAAAESALPGLVDPLCNAGLLERSVGSVRARVDVRPYADDEHDWWVVSDLTPGLDGSPNRVGTGPRPRDQLGVVVAGAADRARPRSAARSTWAPGAASSRSTSPSTSGGSSPPTSTAGRWR